MHIDAGELLLLLESDLLDAGWDGTLDPYPGQVKAQFAMSHLRRSLVKKYLPGNLTTTPEADSKAIDKFMKINESCANFRLDTTSMASWERTVVGEVKNLIDTFFYPDVDSPFLLCMDSLVQGFGVGPGASIGSSENDFYSKFSTSNLAATSETLHKLYVKAISYNPTWRDLEEFRARKMGYKVVTGSRLSCVPKTAEISRVICTEPMLNMVFQKGIGNAIEKRLIEVFGIDLRLQPDRNSELARIGSLSGRFGTIDLSSASDSISMGLCKDILPQRVYDLLSLCRSPYTVFPDGRHVELHMVSSMGNAFTFPLQTLLFAAIVCSCYRVCGIKPVHSRGSLDSGVLGNYAVFGDDIIVDSRVYSLVSTMLAKFGFVVNADKSFNEGPFRESCGSDYFSGHFVRGVYISSLRDENDCFSAINRLVRWSAEHGVYLNSLVRFLRKRCRFYPIPPDESDDMGIKVPSSMLTGRSSVPGLPGSIIYRIRKLRDRSISLKSAVAEPKLNGWFENPSGLLMAFLAGSIRNGSVVLRSTARRAVTRKRYTSRWDYIPFARGESRDYAARWEWAAEWLLSKEPF